MQIDVRYEHLVVEIVSFVFGDVIPRGLLFLCLLGFGLSLSGGGSALFRYEEIRFGMVIKGRGVCRNVCGECEARE